MIGTESGAPKLLVDNQSAITLSKNPVFHERSKHIDVCYHYIRECVDKGRIIIDHTTTEEQLANILTCATRSASRLWVIVVRIRGEMLLFYPTITNTLI
jgi:hypothetical protein